MGFNIMEDNNANNGNNEKTVTRWRIDVDWFEQNGTAHYQFWHRDACVPSAITGLSPIASLFQPISLLKPLKIAVPKHRILSMLRCQFWKAYSVCFWQMVTSLYCFRISCSNWESGVVCRYTVSPMLTSILF